MTLQTVNELEVRQRDVVFKLIPDDPNSRVGMWLGNTEIMRLSAAQIAPLVGFSLGAVNIGDVTSYPMLEANNGRTHIVPDLTANCTISLPAAAANLYYEWIYGGVAADGQNWIIDALSNTNYFLGGLMHADHDAGAAGDEIVPVAGNGSSNSRLTVVTPHVGTLVRAWCDGTNWFLAGFVNSATIPSFADQA